MNEQPTILVDTREQTPLVFRNLASRVASLGTGDYSLLAFEDSIAFERKSIADLVSSLSHDRERFERELCRLRGMVLSRLVVVGHPEDINGHTYRSRMEPKAVWASLDALSVRYGVAYEFHATPEDAALRIERLSWYFWRDARKRFGKVPSCEIKHQTPIVTKP